MCHKIWPTAHYEIFTSDENNSENFWSSLSLGSAGRCRHRQWCGVLSDFMVDDACSDSFWRQRCLHLSIICLMLQVSGFFRLRKISVGARKRGMLKVWVSLFFLMHLPEHITRFPTHTSLCAFGVECENYKMFLFTTHTLHTHVILARREREVTMEDSLHRLLIYCSSVATFGA
jgi:hypothetical protein